MDEKRKELERLRAYAREASIVLMRFSGGGSEMFTQIGAEFYAEPALCESRWRERQDMLDRMRKFRATSQEPSHG